MSMIAMLYALSERPDAPPTYVTHGALDGATGALTYAMPVGYALNDIGLLLVETDNQAITCSGWTALATHGAGTAGVGDATMLASFWKRLAASETDPVTTDSGDHQIGRMIIVRGCPTTGTPVSILSGVCDSVAASPMSWSAATTTSANNLIIHVVTAGEDASGAHTSAWSSTTLVGASELFDTGAVTGNGGSLSAYIGTKQTAGSLGTVTTATSRTLPQNMARVTFAFVPA